MNAVSALGAAAPLTSGGVALATTPDALGMLTETDPASPAALLRERMARDGYVLLRGLLDRTAVHDARAEITRRLAAAGALRRGTDPLDARADRAARKLDREVRAGLARGNRPLHDLLYGPAMMGFFARFFGEAACHYDFTWFRAVAPGPGTPAHADVVFMGRAERERLFTAWTPIGAVDLVQGGLMVLEGSCRTPALERAYYPLDVDARCTNAADPRDEWEKGSNGWLGTDPAMIRHRLGGRWLTASYAAGDVLLFSVFTVHASLDNRSDRIRLSADSRYQPASAPADERWIGPNPPGHGPGGKRDLIC
ncbi:MAG TPA: phytanoyl-CoA dioxygenase family protein [Acetobacteraceae bacterium]|jgi:hypothetical protein|nr:phytanoyl-CoA dioxygenase family protein [Acetobacteraceae bacterium]